jgi:uncharacterized protein (TIGR02147 family)
MPNIFNYINYRAYLLDFYKEKKSANPGFSFQLIANKAGFKSKSFFPHVIGGKKNLSKESLFKLNSVLNLSDKSFSYLCDIVAFEQARTPKEKNYYFSRITEYSERNQAKMLLQEQYEFYSRWYHNTIRELACLVDFKDDYRLLGRLVKPAISARQARASVQLLLKLGLLERKGQGYKMTERNITTGDQIRSLAVHNFHLQNFAIAGESLNSCPSELRDISCLVSGLSPEGYETVRKEIQAFRKKLVSIISHDKPSQRVYHISFFLFPTSENIEQRSKKHE